MTIQTRVFIFSFAEVNDYCKDWKGFHDACAEGLINRAVSFLGRGANPEVETKV